MFLISEHVGSGGLYDVSQHGIHRCLHGRFFYDYMYLYMCICVYLHIKHADMHAVYASIHGLGQEWLHGASRFPGSIHSAQSLLVSCCTGHLPVS